MTDVRSKPQQDCQPGQILYCTTECIPVDLMFQENFPTNTSLEPLEPSKWLPTEWIGLSYLSVLQQQPVLGTSVIRRSSVHHVQGLGWQPTDCNGRQLRSQRLLWLWLAQIDRFGNDEVARRAGIEINVWYSISKCAEIVWSLDTWSEWMSTICLEGCCWLKWSMPHREHGWIMCTCFR